MLGAESVPPIVSTLVQRNNARGKRRTYAPALARRSINHTTVRGTTSETTSALFVWGDIRVGCPQEFGQAQPRVRTCPAYATSG